MATLTLTLPLLRAAAWFAEDPGLAPGGDGFLDLAWGEPAVAGLEPLQRRRLSPLARGCFHCAGRVDPPAEAALVFASRHGEAERTLAMLRDLAAQAELSPTLFSLSVHNAVAGQWSILRGVRSGICALAAGPESFGWGLVEALATWRAEPGRPVLYLFGDERLPELWAGPTPPGLAHAVALLLGEPAGRQLVLERDPRSAGAEPDLPQSMAFLHALRAGRAGWAGPDGAWTWRCP